SCPPSFLSFMRPRLPRPASFHYTTLFRSVSRVHVPHVVALAVGHHLEREFVVIAQENGPLARVRDVGRLLQDLDDRMPVLHGDRDRKSTRLNSSHQIISYAVFCLKKKKQL